MSDFAALGLSEDLVRAVHERGYTTPTPVQVQAIPVVLDGRDLIAGAQTGTGKTAAFTLPLLALLKRTPPAPRRLPRALILTPTRELAAQVEESVRHYGRHSGLRSLVMFGGVGINPQIEGLKRGVDVLVATPGRLLDHLQQRTVDLSKVEMLVLDEADRMLDMGFIRDIRRVLAVLPKQRQNLLFSATFPPEIKELAASLLKDPAEVEIARQGTTAAQIAQEVLLVDRNRKKELLVHLFETRRWTQALVFTRTKHLANRLAEHLDKHGISALAIHGNKSQTARTRALSEFKSGKLQALVATDIAARGIDINELPQVVNFELPMVAEDYVHRIGRTARAGATGSACSLVCVDEHRLLESIERLTRQRFERRRVAGYEPDPNQRPEPIETGRGQRGGGRPQQGQARQGQPQSGHAQQGQRAADGNRRQPHAQGNAHPNGNRRPAHGHGKPSRQRAG
ncbi:MAG TPA: DEAD/DEAH box helicase [Gammaproteobacteria bacterium]|nr:DEAD/DEAH box helicase [Gammaproteobacteria bacterium]